MKYMQEIDEESFHTVQRISWGMKMPVPVVMDVLLSIAPLMMDREQICSACMDKCLCHKCRFNPIRHRNNDELIHRIIKKGERKT